MHFQNALSRILTVHSMHLPRSAGVVTWCVPRRDPFLPRPILLLGAVKKASTGAKKLVLRRTHYTLQSSARVPLYIWDAYLGSTPHILHCVHIYCTSFRIPMKTLTFRQHKKHAPKHHSRLLSSSLTKSASPSICNVLLSSPGAARHHPSSTPSQEGSSIGRGFGSNIGRVWLQPEETVW